MHGGRIAAFFAVDSSLSVPRMSDVIGMGYTLFQPHAFIHNHHADCSMTKCFSRFQANISGPPSECRKWAFEVTGQRVVTYRKSEFGVFKRKTDYEYAEETALMTGMTVEISSRDESTGSGICYIKSSTGTQVADFHIYKNVDEFASRIKAAVA